MWRWAPWLVGSALVCVLFFVDFTHSIHGNLEHKAYWGRDFVNLWVGGHLLRAGRADLIYDLAGYRAFLATLFGPLAPHNYSYPPATFPIAMLMSLLPYGAALALWLGGTGALFVWAARPWWPERWGPPWLALLTPAATINIWAGHYGFLIGALFLTGWRRIEQQRPLEAGFWFGLIVIKPHLAVLIPVALIARREWRAIAAAAVTVAAIVLVTGLAFGWQPWIEFLTRTAGVQAGMIDAGKSFFRLMSASTAGAVLLAGGKMPIALAAQLLSSVAALTLVIVAAVRGAAIRDLALLAATATFLALPYAFNYDMTAVMIGALAVMQRRDLANFPRWLATAGFVAPQIGMVLAAIDLPLMPLMIAGLATVQFRLCIAAAPGPDSPFKRHTASTA